MALKSDIPRQFPGSALSPFLNKLTATPSLHLLGAYSFFHIQSYSTYIMASIPSPPYFINSLIIFYFVCLCCLFLFCTLATQLSSSHVVNALCDPSEPRSSLSDAPTFASAHALISLSNSASNVSLTVGVPSLRQCSTSKYFPLPLRATNHFIYRSVLLM